MQELSSCQDGDAWEMIELEPLPYDQPLLNLDAINILEDLTDAPGSQTSTVSSEADNDAVLSNNEYLYNNAANVSAFVEVGSPLPSELELMRQLKAENEMELQRLQSQQPLLKAMFNVHFQGHPLSPIRTIGVFFQKDLESLLMPLRKEFGLSATCPLTIFLFSNEDDLKGTSTNSPCNVDDFLRAAAHSSKSTLVSAINNSEIGGDVVASADVELPELDISLRPVGHLVLQILALPFDCEFETVTWNASSFAMINLAYPWEEEVQRLHRLVVPPENFSIIDKCLHDTANRAAVLNPLCIRNSERYYFPCYSEDSSRQMHLEMPHGIILADSVVQAHETSCEFNSTAATAEPLTQKKTQTNDANFNNLLITNSSTASAANPNASVDDTIAVAFSTNSSLLDCVQQKLAELGIILLPQHLIELCQRSSTVDGVLEYYWNNSDRFPSANEATGKNHTADIDTNGTTSLRLQVAAALAMLGIVLPHSRIADICRRSSTVEGALEYYWNNQDLFAAVEEVPAAQAAAVVVDTTSSNPLFAELADGLLTLGIDLPAASILELSMRSSSVQGCLDYYWNNSALFDGGGCVQPVPADESIFPPVTKECPICQDDFSIESMYSIGCCQSHRCCFECMSRLLVIHVLGDAETQPHIPACPLANAREGLGCNHLLTEDEICQAANLACANGLMDAGTVQRMHATIARLYASKGFRDNGYVRCVGCRGSDDDAFWFQVHTEQETVVCPREECRSEFCSKCLRSPSHYASRCEDVMAYSRAWVEWTTSGRNHYLRALDIERQELAAEREARLEAHAKEVAAAEARFQELTDNEVYKSKNCKRCPTCNRVVEKLDGCDLMVCGQNYHGGDVQNGCGARFRWSAATAYIADTGDKRLPDGPQNLPPEEAQQVHHKIAEGYNYICDICIAPIVGPRICCLNCPSVNLCLNCSLQPHERQFSGSSNKGHTLDHICRVILKCSI